MLGFGGIPDTPIGGIHGGLEVLALEARDHSGQVIDHSESIKYNLQLCKEDGFVPILHSVFGSSTGINKDFIFNYDFVETVKNLNGVKVANAVQGRLEKPWLKEALDKDAVVMTSGSRFYRGPPHSGAVFIPPSIMQRLQQVDSEEI